MRYRDLGATGMKVSILSLGASALGSVYRQINDEEAIQVVHESLRSGINYIDAAPWYGHGKAETLLGKAFKGVPRESFYFSTKVCRYEAPTLEMFDFTAERTLRSIDESLARTGLEYIDVVQIHDPEFCPNQEILLNEVLPALEQARQQGKIRFIGMTGYPLEVQQEIIEKSKVKIDTSLVYCHYSLNATTLETSGYVDFLKEKGIGLVNASPIAMGLLTSRGPPSWHPANHQPHIIDACNKANAYCLENGCDISKLAMFFTLANQDIPTTLVTSANPGRMASNIATVHETPSENEAAVLEHILREFFPWRGEYAKATWVGVEPTMYWTKVGQELECLRRYPNYEAAAPDSHVQGK